jgi:hypothetical protein
MLTAKECRKDVVIVGSAAAKHCNAYYDINNLVDTIYKFNKHAFHIVCSQYFLRGHASKYLNRYLYFFEKHTVQT